MALTTFPRPVTMRSTDDTWTASDWELLPDDGIRYEIIDGVLFMSTAPSLFHQWISSRIYQVLEAQVGAVGEAFVFYAPVGVFMPGCDPVQPDLVVVRRAEREILHDKRVFGVPALLVEILSPSNADVDEETKLAAYARAGVPEYWVVRPATQDMRVYTEPDMRGRYASVAHIPADGELTSSILPVRVHIAAFFADAPDVTV